MFILWSADIGSVSLQVHALARYIPTNAALQEVTIQDVDETSSAPFGKDVRGQQDMTREADATDGTRIREYEDRTSINDQMSQDKAEPDHSDIDKQDAVSPLELEDNDVSHVVDSPPHVTNANYEFPDPANALRLKQLADELPDYVHIPIQMVIGDEVLEGWEDRWFSAAEYDAQSFGNLTEPKIDFVYTCWCLRLDQHAGNRGLTIHRGEWIRRSFCRNDAALRGGIVAE